MSRSSRAPRQPRTATNTFKHALMQAVFPPLPIALAGTAAAVAGLAWVFTGDVGRQGTPIAYVTYPLSAWALVIWCARVGHAIPTDTVRRAVHANPIAHRIATDRHLRLGITTAASFALDVLWTASNALAAITQQSAWFVTLASYYAVLSLMRLPLSIVILKRGHEDGLAREHRLRRACGAGLALTTPVFAGFVILALSHEGTVSYQGSLIFAAALYAFYSIISSTMRFARHRRDHRPAVDAANAVQLVVAGVSMLSLEVAMLDRFGTESDGFRFLMIAATGGAICALTCGMGVWMAVTSGRALRTEQLSRRPNGRDGA